MIHKKHPKTKSESIHSVNPLNTQRHQQPHWQLMPSDGSWCLQTSKGFRTFVVQSQGTKMPSSTSIKGGAKGNSTVNFQPFPLNQNVCYAKSSRRSVKGTHQLALLALPATGPHATLHVSCTPIRWSQPTSTTFGSTEEHHALSWINGKAPICH